MIGTLETPGSIRGYARELDWNSDLPLTRVGHQLPPELTYSFNGLLDLGNRSSLVPLQIIKASLYQGMGEVAAVSCTFVHHGNPKQAVQKLFIPVEDESQEITVASGLVSPHESFLATPPADRVTQAHLQLAGQILASLKSQE